jgi:hypothetical protein
MINDNDLSMTVEFTQTITIRPPDCIEGKVDAYEWFHNDSARILQDAIGVRQGNVKVLTFNEGDE